MSEFTIVTLVDEDGDEFPIRLPGAYPANRGADIEAALQILHENKAADLQKPNGELTVRDIEYVGRVS